MDDHEVAAKPKRETVQIDSEDGVKLVADLYHPTHGADDAGKYLAVVVTHPHPKLGGSYDNSVVIELARAICDVGGMCLCPNTRGVGKSTGRSSWKGDKEVADVVASANFLLARQDVRSLSLVGYSFGSAITTSAVPLLSSEISGVALLSPPWGKVSMWLLGHHYRPADKLGSLPKFFVAGTDDAFSSKAQFDSAFQAFPEPKEKLQVSKASHFWMNREDQAADPIAAFIKRCDENKSNSSKT